MYISLILVYISFLLGLYEGFMVELYSIYRTCDTSMCQGRNRHQHNPQSRDISCSTRSRAGGQDSSSIGLGVQWPVLLLYTLRHFPAVYRFKKIYKSEICKHSWHYECTKRLPFCHIKTCWYIIYGRKIYTHEYILICHSAPGFKWCHTLTSVTFQVCGMCFHNQHATKSRRIWTINVL